MAGLQDYNIQDVELFSFNLEFDINIFKKAKFIPKNDTIPTPNELYYINKTKAKPFVKWAGGKGQLLDKFKSLYPKKLKDNKIKNYYEPFLGSGAVFFDIIQNYKIENAYLYDINDELILTYKVIQEDVFKLIDFLYRYEVTYLKLNKKKRQEFYYEQRINYNLQRFNIDYNKFSDNWFSRAAQLIFLNKTCFNGLYRVNLKGDFNSPVGDYDNPKICNEDNLLVVSKLLEIAEIKKADYKEIINDLKKNSFVYFDPPYRPISKTANFKSYSRHEFSDKNQIQLSQIYKKLDELEICTMLSNSDPKNIDQNDNFFDILYKDYNIIRIPARRLINSNPLKRGEINEIIITNYKTENLEYIPVTSNNIKLFIQNFDKPYWIPKLKIPINDIKIDKSRFSYCNDINNELVIQIINHFDIDFWIPITIDKENFLIDGQHRLEAAKRMGLKYIDVVIQDTQLL